MRKLVPWVRPFLAALLTASHGCQRSEKEERREEKRGKRREKRREERKGEGESNLVGVGRRVSGPETEGGEHGDRGVGVPGASQMGRERRRQGEKKGCTVECRRVAGPKPRPQREEATCRKNKTHLEKGLVSAGEDAKQAQHTRATQNKISDYFQLVSQSRTT